MGTRTEITRKYAREHARRSEKDRAGCWTRSSRSRAGSGRNYRRRLDGAAGPGPRPVKAARKGSQVLRMWKSPTCPTGACPVSDPDGACVQDEVGLTAGPWTVRQSRMWPGIARWWGPRSGPGHAHRPCPLACNGTSAADRHEHHIGVLGQGRDRAPDRRIRRHPPVDRWLRAQQRDVCQAVPPGRAQPPSP